MNGVWSLAVSYLAKYRVLRFMVVGGIGYLILLAIYYPLLPLFQDQITFLGKQFYLPPFAIALVLASVCTYLMCKKWAFGGRRENRLGPLRFSLLVVSTFVGDLVVLFLLVEFLGLNPILAAIITVWVVFIIRYTVASRWIWS